MVIDNDSVATQTGFDIWRVVQTVTGALVVASILALAGVVVGNRDSIREHNILLEQSAEFAKRGNRYTEKDGERDRDARDFADTILSNAINGLQANQKAFEAALREHAEIRQHVGAGFRMDEIEKRNSALNAELHELKEKEQ